MTGHFQEKRIVKHRLWLRRSSSCENAERGGIWGAVYESAYKMLEWFTCKNINHQENYSIKCQDLKKFETRAGGDYLRVVMMAISMGNETKAIVMKRSRDWKKLLRDSSSYSHPIPLCLSLPSVPFSPAASVHRLTLHVGTIANFVNTMQSFILS